MVISHRIKSFSVLEERISMDKKCMVYKAETFDCYTQWSASNLCRRFKLKTNRVRFKVPFGKHASTDGGNPDAPLQHFYSNALPSLIPSIIDGTIRINNKLYLAVIPEEPLYKKEGLECISLTLHGARGFVGGLNILNSICNTLFSRPGVVQARSIMYSDLIGNNSWVETLHYKFGENEYTPESYMLKHTYEEPGSTKEYPTWITNCSGEEKFADSRLIPFMKEKIGCYWLASRIALPFENPENDWSTLRFSVGAFDNGYFRMNSNLFISNNQSTNGAPLLELSQSYFIKPVIFVDSNSLGSSAGPLRLY